MKKLYFLNEEEKQRILRLHKSHQIGKTWLTEQGDTTPDVSTSPLPRGTWTREQKTDFDLLLVPPKAGGRNTFIKNIKQYCLSTPLGDPTLTHEDISRNARQTDVLMSQNAYTFTIDPTNRGFYEPKKLSPYILALKNIPNFCYSIKNFNSLRGSSDTILDIYDEIAAIPPFNKYIIEPLTQIAAATRIAKYGDAETDDTEETIDPVTGEKKKKKKVPGVEPVTHTGNNLTSEFEKTFPCLAGIAEKTSDFKSVYVLNPSATNKIFEMPDGNLTKISERIVFRNDGNYYLKSKRGRPSGKWQCDEAAQEDVEITPIGAGVGNPGGLVSEFPCLADYNIEEDKDFPGQGVMSDESRARHHALSSYPKGRVIFYKNGTFITEFDLKAKKKITGIFSCEGYKKQDLEVSRKESASWDERQKALEPEYRYPDPERPKNRMSGMGIVSASSSYITEILKCAKIGGSTLDQTALNKLYDYIKNNK